MANSQILLAELKVCRCSNTSEVRLLRFWEARNVKKGGQFMSIDILFVDKSATVVQVSVDANHQLRFRERLREGSIYNFSGFDVVRSSTNFRICDTPHSIRFNDQTFIEEAPISETQVPTEFFKFIPYTQLLEVANTGKQLPGATSVEFIHHREPIEVVPILRNGLGLAEQSSSALPANKIYHSGIRRDEKTLLPSVYLKS